MIGSSCSMKTANGTRPRSATPPSAPRRARAAERCSGGRTARSATPRKFHAGAATAAPLEKPPGTAPARPGRPAAAPPQISTGRWRAPLPPADPALRRSVPMPSGARSARRQNSNSAARGSAASSGTYRASAKDRMRERTAAFHDLQMSARPRPRGQPRKSSTSNRPNASIARWVEDHRVPRLNHQKNVETSK